MNEILFTVGGVVSTVIGFFLVRLINEHDKTKAKVIELNTKIALLENNHTHLSESLEKLNVSIEKLTDKIDYLTKVVNSH